MAHKRQNIVKNEKESASAGEADLHSLDAYSMSAHLRNGAVGVLATDTLYGLVGSAFYPDVVARIFQLKRRNINKPVIVLVSDVEQMKFFGVELTREVLRALQTYWPGRYSIVLPTKENARFDYLTRGTGTIAFRMPDRADLFELLDLAGPIVAPSANLEGTPPATTIEEARAYFGDEVDFYADAGKVEGRASTVITFEDGQVKYLRD
jgi:L-threonylcarbamoyladenylate synthase